MKNWTEKDIRQLASGNKIKGFVMAEKKEPVNGNRIPAEKKRSAEKEWLELNLQYWCNKKGLTLDTEFVFDEPREFHGQEIARRKFRFDFCIHSIKVAIEYEGIMNGKSGHTTISGFTSNTEKYNRAAQLGWHLQRYTALNYKNVITDLDTLVEKLNLC